MTASAPYVKENKVSLVDLLEVIQYAHKTRHGKTSSSVWVGSIGSRVKLGCESSRVDPYFSNNFFFLFFEIDAICQLFMSSLTVIRFLLVILLPITSKHLTWYPNLV